MSGGTHGTVQQQTDGMMKRTAASGAEAIQVTWLLMADKKWQQQAAQRRKAVADSWHALPTTKQRIKAAEEATRVQQKKEIQRLRTANRKMADSLQAAAETARAARQEVDEEKVRRAKNKRREIMVNRWKQMQETLKHEGSMSKQLRGQIYALCDSTLAQWSKSSLVAAVESRLRQEDIGSWAKGKTRLMQAVAQEEGERDADKRHQDVQEAVGAMVSVIEASQSPGWKHDDANSSEARIMNAAVGEVMYTAAASVARRWAGWHTQQRCGMKSSFTQSE